MRRSNDYKTQTLINKAGDIYGIVLAADSVSEHQNGIKDIHHAFGIKGGNGDFDDFCATRYPNSLANKNYPATKATSRKNAAPKSSMIAMAYEDDIDSYAKMLTYRDFPVSSCWNERHFMMRGYGDEGQKVIEVIRKAITQKDLAIWTGGSTPFGGGGLAFAKRSMIDQENIDLFNKEKKEWRDLVAAAEATGIAKRLKEKNPVRNSMNNEPYYALAPNWINGKKSSAHPVHFFLNPRDQKNNNFGWFTVEELDQWIEGKGPIPKANTQETAC